MATPIPNRGPELLAVDIAFLSAAVIAYLLRCYVRITMVKAFGRDDWLMAIATLGFIAYASSSMLGVHYGTGRHRKDLSVDGYQKARHCWWFCYLFYCVSMIGSKLSIGFFLLRIAIKKTHVYIIYMAMLISVIAGMTFFFVTLFQCNPISYFWDTTSQNGSCIKIDVIVALGYLYSVFSIISDFTFAILPAFLVMTLQLKRRTKIALIPVLAMGCIASAAVVARVPYMKSFRSEDFLWDTTDVAIWSTVEQGLAITAGSLASVRPLFNGILHKLGFASQPTVFREYGKQSSSHAFGSRTQRSRHHDDDLDMYKLSERAESRATDEENADCVIPGDDVPAPIKSPSWYATRFQKNKGGASVTTTRVDGDSESDKSLRITPNVSEKDVSRTVSEERSMQIMVERSFFVTDEERASFVEKKAKE